jgi:hypothetical protein
MLQIGGRFERILPGSSKTFLSTAGSWMRECDREIALKL